MGKPTDLLNINTIDVTPLYVAQRCVVCNGWGTVAKGAKKCGSCGGKGYILIPASVTNRYTIPANSNNDSSWDGS